VNEVILTRCAKTWDGESLYRVTVDGRELTPLLTLAETIEALRMVEEVTSRERI
jgi:hypothetical protein